MHIGLRSQFHQENLQVLLLERPRSSSEHPGVTFESHNSITKETPGLGRSQTEHSSEIYGFLRGILEAI